MFSITGPDPSPAILGTGLRPVPKSHKRGLTPSGFLLALAASLVVTGCAGLPPTPSPPVKPALTEEIDAARLVELTEQSFDPRTGEIRYILPVEARVRIRMGVAKGPLMRTLLNWEPQEAGEHRLIWDGADDSSQFHFKNHPNVTAFLAAYSLPATSVMTSGKPDSQRLPEHEKADAVISRPAGRETSSLEAHESPDLHHHSEPPDLHHHGAAHAEHSPSECRPPKLTLSFPGQPTDPAGTPILDGVVPVRLEIAEADRPWVSQERFGWSLFVDYVFWHEEMQGLSPMTFHLDTRGFNEGPHLISANLESYEDHIGTSSAMVLVRKPKP